MTSLPAIVLAAFGASSAKARLAYSEIETSVRAAYPQHEIRWAFLSRHIADTQRQRGVAMPSLPEVLATIQNRGIASAVVQPILVTPGEEFHVMKATSVPGLHLAYGDALLCGEDSLQAALAAIAPLIEPEIPHVLVCHGNRKYEPYNLPLLQLQRLAEHCFPNLFVASIEGVPGIGCLDEVRLRAQTCGGVAFVPFMMVSGEHVANDVMGDAKGSWRNLVAAPRCVCREPLGLNPGIHRIFLQRIAVALKTLAKGTHHD